LKFSDSFLDEVVDRNDITDVVSGYVQLTKRSGNNQFGLCPFHNEKTPSFSVSSDKQIYHCFGCGKGGGVINFIMEIESMSFPEAVELLAKRAGLAVPDRGAEPEAENRRGVLLNLNRDAAKFYFNNLSLPEGRAAVEYLSGRKISKRSTVNFGLGAAPDSWNSLMTAMLQKGYKVKDLLDNGLIKKSSKDTYYDTFRNRLMFPVIDVRGNVIGFSGRILGDGEPKYLNTKDSLLFNKSKSLFAINIAKKSKLDYFILAEGNIDVVILHQAGFDSSVASLGTSLTPDQAKLISRFTDNVIIAYDSDEAGIKATQRAIGIFDSLLLNVRILEMPGAKDPDDYIKRHGAAGFSNLIDKSNNHIDYRLLLIKKKHDIAQDTGRIEFLTEAVEFIADIGNSILRDLYSGRVSEYAGVSKEAVALEVKKALKRRYSKQKRELSRLNQNPVKKVQPSDRSIRYENIRSAMAEEGMIRLLFIDSTLFDEDEIEKLGGQDFSSPFLGEIFDNMKARYRSKHELKPADILAGLSPPQAEQLSAMLQKPVAKSNRLEALNDYIDTITFEKQKSNKDMTEIFQAYREKKGIRDGDNG
jgi:DNA primase